MDNIYVESIFISASSNYWSHPKGNPGIAPTEPKNVVECVAGKGIKGDRFFDFKENYVGQITFMDGDALREFQKIIKQNFNFDLFRRNVILSGIDPLSLEGKKFRIGEVIFEGICDCTPCQWMDEMIAPGTLKWLAQNKKGGLRAKIIQSGPLKINDKLTVI